MALVKIVGGFIENNDGDLLLIQEGRGSRRGEWKFLTGRILNGEEPQQAFYREVREEIGCEANILGEIGRYGYKGRRGDEVFRIDYRARITDESTPIPKRPEVMGIMWLPISKIPEFLIAHPHQIRYQEHFGRYLNYILRVEQRKDLTKILNQIKTRVA